MSQMGAAKSFWSGAMGCVLLGMFAACGGTTVEPALASPVDNDRDVPPSPTLASDQCSSSVAGATVGVEKTDAGERVVDVKLGPQELSGVGCRGRRTSGTVTSE